MKKKLLRIAAAAVLCLVLAVPAGCGGDEDKKESGSPVSGVSGEDIEDEISYDVSDAEVSDTGTCGTDVTYTLYDNGVLMIEGKGSMNDYDSSMSPFQSDDRISIAVIKDGVTSIGAVAFDSCKSLKSVVIPDGLQKIDMSAFRGCSGLTGFYAGEGNQKYSSASGVLFNKSGDTLLKCPEGKSGSYVIPDEAVNIDGSAFFGCRLLTDITIPAGVSTLGAHTFEQCTGLTAFEVSEDNESFSSQEGILYDKEQKTLICCPGGIEGAVIVPEGVSAIGAYAFERCEKLTGISLPESVNEIREFAFLCCKSLKQITLPKDITELSSNVFKDCTGLESLTLPQKLREIKISAMSGCTGIKSIEIPQTVTKIDFGAFEGWTKNQTIVVKGRKQAPKTWNSNWNIRCSATVKWEA